MNKLKDHSKSLKESKPAFLAQNEEALATAGYYRSRQKTTALGSGFSMSQGNRGRGGSQGSIAQSATESNRRSYARSNQKQDDVYPESHVSELEKPLNPKDASGQILNVSQLWIIYTCF